MAKASTRGANTTLIVGGVKAEVSLFPTVGDPADVTKFQQAGPNGKRLFYEERAVAVDGPEPEQAQSPFGEEPKVPLALDDILGQQPAPAPATPWEPPTAVDAGPFGSGPVPGEMKRVLVEEENGAAVEDEQVRRGLFREDGAFVDLTDQIDAITERTKLETMEVVAVIDRTKIGTDRITGSRYIGTRTGKKVQRHAKVMRLLYEALGSHRAAVVKYTTRTRQNLGVIVASKQRGCLVLLDVAFAENFREVPDRAKAIQAVQVSDDHVLSMKAILGSFAEKPDVLDDERDAALALREELAARALAGEMDVRVVEPVVELDQADDLEDLLAQSIANLQQARAA